jgi:hypothetical protein
MSTIEDVGAAERKLQEILNVLKHAPIYDIGPLSSERVTFTTTTQQRSTSWSSSSAGVLW